MKFINTVENNVITEFSREIQPRHFKFFLHDKYFNSIEYHDWTGRDIKKRVSTRKSSLGIRTLNKSTTRVEVRIVPNVMKEDPYLWHFIGNCEIIIPSGKLYIREVEDDLSRIPGYSVPSERYDVSVYQSNQSASTPGCYRINLRPEFNRKALSSFTENCLVVAS